MFLKFVTHDAVNNTLEAQWYIAVEENGEIVEYRSAKRRNYSPAEKADFLTDLGADGQKYVDMAGW